MPNQQRLWPALAHEITADARQPGLPLAAWLVPLLLTAALRGLEAEVPAPLSLAAGTFYTVMALGVGMVGGAVQMAAACQRGAPRLAVLLFSRLVLVGMALLATHVLARGLGMPPLPHPVSTTLALLATALCYVGLGMLIGRLAATTSRAAWSAVLLAGLFLALQALPALSPAGWSRLVIQMAVTGTGTRAAASGLAALAGLGVLALFAARLVPRRWPLALLVAGWLALANFVWQRPGPPLPQADMLPVSLAASLPPDTGRVAPIAATAPDAALTSALARVTRQIAKWPPAADPDPVQRARNLLLIAAVPDLYDTDPLQSHLPLLVEAELKQRLPADQLPALLAAIAAQPGQGSAAARESLPRLGLPANTGDEARLRERISLYAAKLLARQRAAP